MQCPRGRESMAYEYPQFGSSFLCLTHDRLQLAFFFLGKNKRKWVPKDTLESLGSSASAASHPPSSLLSHPLALPKPLLMSSHSLFNEYLICTSLCQAQRMERRKVSFPSSHENAQDHYCTCMSGCVHHHYTV